MAVDPTWNPNDGAVWKEQDSAHRIVGIRHPAHPYVRALQANVAWQKLANDYVKAIHDNLSHLVGREWLRDLWDYKKSNVNLALRWLPLPAASGSDPRQSQVVTRAVEGRTEASLVLVACLAVPGSNGHPDNVLYGGEGIRVIAHVMPDSNEPASHLLRFTSFATTLPAYPSIPKHERLFVDPTLLDVRVLARILGAAFNFSGDIDAFSEIGRRLGDPVDPAGTFQILAKTTPISEALFDDRALSYAFVATVDEKRQGLNVARYPLTAFADLQANVFDTDPMTIGGPGRFRDYRPNRSWKTLDLAQQSVKITNLQPGQNGGIELASAASYYEVVNSEFADEGLPANAPKEVASPVNEHTRTNLFAAATACNHVDGLFRRMNEYGIDPDDYFRFVDLPLVVRYRAGIIPGPGRDGRTINAQVLWLTKPMTDEGVFVPGSLEARFALADLQSCPEASPLGVVVDQRWCWHEFSHVLICAATGDLEYRFAHSSGDAMGAILNDPYSALATDVQWRGVTFPWVSLPARRHDRRAREGWSWCGSLYGKERTYAHGGCDRRGYWSEQMLSTTLFNIYRILGGDTGLGSAKGTWTADIRDAASAYTLCLIMQANRFLGPAAVTPVDMPDGFATALISADIAIDAFLRNNTTRCGGSAQKVIRWAFEHQGLYQLGNVSADAPGAPPPVDIFIDDQRHPIDPQGSKKPKAKARGGYDPVPLDTTKWYATDDDLDIQPKPSKSGKNAPLEGQPREYVVRVRVGNRGQQTATAATVTVWVAVTNANGAIEDWNNGKWTQLAGPGQAKDIPAGKSRTFGPFDWAPQPPGKYALVAVASCADDPSNADPGTYLACALAQGRTDFLVSCDNNLGLRKFDV